MKLNPNEIKTLVDAYGFEQVSMATASRTPQVKRWLKGEVPSSEQMELLLFLYDVTIYLANHKTPREIGDWSDTYSCLGDSTQPLHALRKKEYDEVRASAEHFAEGVSRH